MAAMLMCCWLIWACTDDMCRCLASGLSCFGCPHLRAVTLPVLSACLFVLDCYVPQRHV